MTTNAFKACCRCDLGPLKAILSLHCSLWHREVFGLVAERALAAFLFGTDVRSGCLCIEWQFADKACLFWLERRRFHQLGKLNFSNTGICSDFRNAM